MTAGVRHWTVRLTTTAEDDLREILRWTQRQFGERQARVYAATLSAALNDLTAGPNIPGARNRDEIASGILSLHVARKGHKGRHFVMFRVAADRGSDVIEVLRLLHDAMDLPRQLTPSDDQA